MTLRCLVKNICDPVTLYNSLSTLNLIISFIRQFKVISRMIHITSTIKTRLCLSLYINHILFRQKLQLDHVHLYFVFRTHATTSGTRTSGPKKRLVTGCQSSWWSGLRKQVILFFSHKNSPLLSFLLQSFKARRV